MARRRKPKQPRIKGEKSSRRNPYALIASWRTGSGTHPDRKKTQDKKACRGRVDTKD